jgi:hypothetical protein
MSRPIRVPVPPASTTATAESCACEEVISELIHPLLTVRYGRPLLAGTVRGASHHYLGRTPGHARTRQARQPRLDLAASIRNLSIVVPTYTNIWLFVYRDP